MKKKFHAKVILMPDGTEVTRGPNGFLTPGVPCDHCGRSIRYYKGPTDQFPWFCSPECKERTSFKVRCDCCHGAMRKPILFGTDTKGKKWVACKSCCLRISYLYHRLSNMDVAFLEYAMQKALPLILKGDLKTNRYRVVGTNFVYVSKDTPTEALPTLPDDPVIRVKKVSDKPKEPEKPVDTALFAWIKLGKVQPDGYYPPGHPWAGKHYRDIYPDPEFPPPDRADPVVEHT